MPPVERTGADVDEFLASVEGSQGDDLRALDRVVSEELDDLPRELWEGVFRGGSAQSIIGYGTITQPRPRGQQAEWFLVGLAAQKQHLSLYVNAVEQGDYLVRHRADYLGNVRVGASAATFKRLADLDLDALRSLLRRAYELAG